MAHLTHYDALFVLAPLPRAERRQLAHALVCDSCRAVLREVLAAQTPAASPETPSRRSRPLDYSAMWTALDAKLAAVRHDVGRFISAWTAMDWRGQEFGGDPNDAPALRARP